jgi:serine/threonine protein kinase
MRLLGEGGMGRVFLAQRIDNAGMVVVKVLHEQIAAQPKFRESFQQEMLLLSNFRHPNVVGVLDASTAEQAAPCLVMEYIPGVTLEQLLNKCGCLDPEHAGNLLGQLCLALQAAHTAGIIHRDLKPANVMVVEPGTPNEKLKVMDFGLAMLATALYIPKERLEKPEEFFSACGTPDYIAPEQVRGDATDHRSDLYSVGVLLYEMLTGRVVFTRPTVRDALLAHANEKPPRFAEVGAADLSPALEAMVLRCLAKYPVERPQSARELCNEYERALGHTVVPPAEWEAPHTRPESVSKTVSVGLVKKLREPNVVIKTLAAWMPERIAVVKLQGFVIDNGGEVVESVPGMIRVRLEHKGPDTAPAAPQGLLSRLGFGSAPPEPPPLRVELELYMEKKDSAGKLDITVLIRPKPGGPLLSRKAWQECADQIHREVKAYLMG